MGIGQVESSCSEQSRNVAPLSTAACQRTPQRLQPVLLALHGCIGRASMFAEQELTDRKNVAFVPVGCHAVAQTQPCFHWAESRKSRHARRIWDFEYTASNSTHSIAAPGNSGSITFETRKCLFLAMGLTAVHLVSSNFFGCSAFMMPLLTFEPGRFTSCEG